MRRTMFLLSDSLHPSSSQHNQAITPPAKKLQGNYTNVCEKDCHCEGPSAVFYASESGFISPSPESKPAVSKYFFPYSTLQLSVTNDYSGKKDDNLVNHSTNTAPAVSDQLNSEIRPTSNIINDKVTIKVVKDRPYSCEDCGKTFLLKHHLVTHARVHSGERPHVCVHCGKTFTHKHCLSTHLLLHTSDRPYTCPECNKSFTLKHHLVTHARVHSQERPYVCQECGRTFPQKRHLVTHAKFHSGERPYVCSECGESFAQEDHLLLHSRFHGERRPYHCQECGLAFARKFELVNHSRIHGINPYSCSSCGKEFLQKRSWQAHLKLHTCGGAVEHPYCCIHCGEAFQGEQELQAHTCRDNEKKFFCRECGNCFSSEEGLSVHLRLHAGDRNFVSDLCGLAVALQQQHDPSPKVSLASAAQRISTLNGNSQHVSSVTIQPNLSGSRENGPEIQAAHLVRTNVSPHSNLPKVFPVNLKPKPHVCQDCGRAFTQKHGLLQHSKRYTNGGCELRRFACEKCGKAFLQRNHLVLHERQHLPPEERNRAQTKTEQLCPLAPTEDPIVMKELESSVQDPIVMKEQESSVQDPSVMKELESSVQDPIVIKELESSVEGLETA